MSSSKSSRNQLLHVRSRSGPVEITLLDKNLNVVATGYGELRRRVEPGIYLLRMDSGALQEERFITIEPGMDFQDLEISLPIKSTAPLAGFANLKEQQRRALIECSDRAQVKLGAGGRLLLFIGNSTEHRTRPIDLSEIGLFGPLQELIGMLDRDAQRNQDEGWACYSADVAPGGYGLRWMDKQYSRWSAQQLRSKNVDQPLWVQKGWITALFLTTNPRRKCQPRMTGMSIHMRRLDNGFRHDDEEIAARINQASELTLHSLSAGDTIVPTDLIDLMTDKKSGNPMLGVLGAHALLLQPEPRWSLFDRVVRTLFKLVPGHPDAVALRILGKLRRRNESLTRSEQVTWPPMIYAAYRALIDRDLDEGGIIESGSVAEQAAVRLLPQGPWTVWATLEDTGEARDPGAVDDLPEAAQVQQIIDVVKKELRPVSRSALQQIVTEKGKDRDIESSAEAIDQVAGFLRNMRRGKTWLSAENIAGQITQVGLPISTIMRVLKHIKKLKD